VYTKNTHTAETEVRRFRFLHGCRALQDGFTLVEVMIAGLILLLGIGSAIVALQRGLQAIDTARNLSYASQLMQSEFENLRLKSWAQLQQLQDSAGTSVPTQTVPGINKSFTCTRTIRDLKADMKEIALRSSWRGYDGREHSVQFVTRYGRSGLYDYFYTAH
jgi:Tfp pilus assembly protein PilV